MTYKEIVCLANSYKKDPGRCIAGKTLIGYKWIRPISSRIEGELFKEQISFSNGEMPQPLDIIKIPIDIEKPTNCQPENVLISSDIWQKTGVFQKDRINELRDNPEIIWQNYGGKNDRIPASYFQNAKVEQSLYLIKPDSCRIEQDKKARAIFTYKAVEYNLGVTDPIAKSEFNEKGIGVYDLTKKEPYLCLSLTDAFKGFCYKLVATVLF